VAWPWSFQSVGRPPPWNQLDFERCHSRRITGLLNDAKYEGNHRICLSPPFFVETEAVARLAGGRLGDHDRVLSKGRTDVAASLAEQRGRAALHGGFQSRAFPLAG